MVGLSGNQEKKQGTVESGSRRKETEELEFLKAVNHGRQLNLIANGILSVAKHDQPARDSPEPSASPRYGKDRRDL
ncbi:hypothetical protein N7452_005655 [Penicillium brevicompactum]|uniref:Uncharacterized protein n=1 Tax=Penicillium brevicompactum TaxID=5074 RepID=A0A9W9QJ13_PENBR|nr:hypothetical protein N7452_005655 [Penicillium brevicompactum]